jgi:hypothetical protein
VTDGGYVVLDKDLEKIEIIYGIGVDGSTEFHYDFITRFPQVQAVRLYDPYISKSQVPPVEKFYYSKYGASDTDQPSNNFYTLETLIKINGDQGKRMILEIDCEGCEWNVF